MSTECSPAKTLDCDDCPLWHPQIIPKIARKLKCAGKSILGFHKGQPKDVEDMTKLILSVIAGEY